MELQNRPDLQLLAKYAALLPDDAKMIVEIGTHLGETALILAKHSPEHVHVYTVDTGERWLWESADIYGQLDSYVNFLQKQFEGHNVFFMLGSSHYKEDEHIVPWEMGEIDLLFIDGDHSYDAVMSDLIRWAPMVRHKGYMLLHDYVLDDIKVYDAIEDYLVVHQEWETLELVSTMLACQKGTNDTLNDPS